MRLVLNMTEKKLLLKFLVHQSPTLIFLSKSLNWVSPLFTDLKLPNWYNLFRGIWSLIPLMTASTVTHNQIIRVEDVWYGMTAFVLFWVKSLPMHLRLFYIYTVIALDILMLLWRDCSKVRHYFTFWDDWWLLIKWWRRLLVVQRTLKLIESQ